MRILITNDDGIYAEGVLPLVQWAKTKGEVTVVAPKVEQSAKSHTIEIHKNFEAKQVDYLPGVTAWAVDSSPADCVRFMVLGRKEKFDLVLSGINRGLNVGTDIMYSGTVAAAYEAVNLGIPALALSTNPGNYDHATEELDRVWEYIREKELYKINRIYNVNVPADPKGFRITRQGGPYYSDDFPLVAENMYRPLGKPVWEDSFDDTLDTDATLHGYITITPLQLDRTNREVYQKLQALCV